MRLPVLLLASVVLCCCPRSGQAQTEEVRATLLSQASDALNKQHNLAQAQDLVRKACEGVQLERCDFAWGSIYRVIPDRLVDMANAFQRYLDKTESVRAPEVLSQREKARRAIDRAQSKLGRVGCQVKGVSFQVEGAAKMPSPGFVWLAPGPHTIHFEGLKEPLSVEVEAGETKTIAPPTAPHPIPKGGGKKIKPSGLTPGQQCQAPSADAELVLKTDVEGTLVRKLAGYPHGLTLRAGETHVRQPPGLGSVSFEIPGFPPKEELYRVKRGESTFVERNWFSDIVLDLGHAPDWARLQNSRFTVPAYKHRSKYLSIIFIGGFLSAAAVILPLGICAGTLLCAPNETYVHTLVPTLGLLPAAILIPIGGSLMSAKMPAPGLDGNGKPVLPAYSY